MSASRAKFACLKAEKSGNRENGKWFLVQKINFCFVFLFSAMTIFLPLLIKTKRNKYFILAFWVTSSTLLKDLKLRHSVMFGLR